MKRSKKDLMSHSMYMAESEEWHRIRAINDAMRKHALKIIDLAKAVDEELARRDVKMEQDYHIEI